MLKRKNSNNKRINPIINRIQKKKLVKKYQLDKNIIPNDKSPDQNNRPKRAQTKKFLQK